MKKVLSRVVTTLLTVCLAIGLLTFTACGVTVELSETEVSLQVGKSITLTAVTQLQPLATKRAFISPRLPSSRRLPWER